MLCLLVGSEDFFAKSLKGEGGALEGRGGDLTSGSLYGRGEVKMLGCRGVDFGVVGWSSLGASGTSNPIWEIFLGASLGSSSFSFSFFTSVIEGG